ncbi:MAG: TolC family outer membrane protein, partial [Pseudoxanthomonas sp.]
MTRRLITLAVALALPSLASATDLLQTYEMARNGDPTLASAESTRLYDKEGQVQARAALLPQLDGTATLSRTTTQLEGLSGSALAKERDLSIDATQTLFDWSSISTLRAQRDVSKAADLTLDYANADLIVRTSEAYFNVLIGIESLAAAEAAEASAKKQFDYADKRLQVGLAPITDVHEARAEYDQARADTITARNTLADYYEALAEITGQPVRNLRGLPDDFKPEVPAYGSVDDLVAAAIEQNQSLLAQKLQVSAAEKNLTAARAGHLPTVSLSGSLGRSKTWGRYSGALAAYEETTNAGSPRTDTNYIGVTLSVPIFAGGATQSAVRQAIATRDIQQDTYEADKRSVARNVRNYYQTVVQGISEIEARRLAVVSAQAAYDASVIGLQVGT